MNVRADLEVDSKWEKLKEETKERYSELVETVGRTVVERLQEDLTEELQRYAPETVSVWLLKGRTTWTCRRQPPACH